MLAVAIREAERVLAERVQRKMAFAMGHHPRLGGGSQVLELEVGVVRMIVDLA